MRVKLYPTNQSALNVCRQICHYHDLDRRKYELKCNKYNAISSLLIEM